MKEYNITGMSCAACSARIEKAVGKINGIKSVSVNLLTNSMVVEGSVDNDIIVDAVVNAGYGASPKSDEKKIKTKSALKDDKTSIMVGRLIPSILLLILLMYVSMGHMMWGWSLPEFLNENYIGIGLFQFIITIIIMIINQRFFLNGFKGIIHKSPNMDTLVALGSGAAFVYSTVLLFLMTVDIKNGSNQSALHYLHDLYFESSAMILTLITVGKMLESYSKGKTTNALKSLMKLSPETSNVIRNGKEITIKTEDILVNDVFIVRAGERVSADGVVIEGESAVDESALTGESIPVDKFPGDKVSAATISRNGYMKCKALSVGKDTGISKIIKMVEDAASSKAPIAKIADKVSGIFVPIVIIIALITIIVWLILGQSIGFSLARGISVLVISCPCALGLATPVAIMVGSGLGAKNGILFKNAESLETAGKTDIICLDKTGTITEGKPVVTDVFADDEDELLAFAYAVESKSEHPLSLAVVNYCINSNIELLKSENVKIIAGNGISATVDDLHIYAGNEQYISKFTEIPEKYYLKSKQISKQGKTSMFFAKGSKFIGIIAVADFVKDDSVDSINCMKKMGLDIVMLTGDNEETAVSIADEVGIKNVVSRVLPSDKEDAVKALSKFGMVTMVGDGINDAPALTRADIGIAIGTGTDVAIDSADIILVKNSLIDIAKAITLSKKVLLNIKENLFWAFIYNIIGIPIAAGVLYPLGIVLNPMIAAASMSLSSFCVVTNALRLNGANINSFKSNKIKRKEIDMNIFEKNKTPYIIIDGMMCEHCEAHVTDALAKIGVVVKANHNERRADILSGNATDYEIKTAVTNAGYKFVEVKR